MNWWNFYHQLMTELHWPPETIGRLTIPQMICILSDRPPGRQPDLPKSEDDGVQAR